MNVKRCNRLVIIPWWDAIPFQELIGDHFGLHVKREVGIISGLVSFRGHIGDHFRVWDHFGSCTILFPFQLKAPSNIRLSIINPPKTTNEDV